MSTWVVLQAKWQNPEHAQAASFDLSAIPYAGMMEPNIQENGHAMICNVTLPPLLDLP